MKSLFKSLTILALVAVFLAPTAARAQDDPDVSFQAFYDNLGDQGEWIQTDDYGYVFQPGVQDPDWAPYTDGHWVDTEDGWLWVSDEPWGWATYHYGRWANIDGTGWVWVPGYRWAPSWVSWRYGDGYAGWAPLPPETFVGAEYGPGGGGGGFAAFHFGGDVDVSFGIGAGCYNFIRCDDFGERNYRGHYQNRHNNYTIINKTKNITNININGDNNNVNVANNTSNSNRNGKFRNVSTGGPTLSEVNAQSRTKLTRAQIRAANQPGKATLTGDTVSVYAPQVNADSRKQARPARIGQEIKQAKLNRGESIEQPLQTTAKFQPKMATQQEIQAANEAESKTPASAKIATKKTQVRGLNQSLNSMDAVSKPTRKEQKAAEKAANANVNPGGNANVSAQQNGGVNPAATGEAGGKHNKQAERQAEKQANVVAPSATGEPAVNNAANKQAEKQALREQQKAQQAQEKEARQQAAQQLQQQHQAEKQAVREQKQSAPSQPMNANTGGGGNGGAPKAEKHQGQGGGQQKPQGAQKSQGQGGGQKAQGGGGGGGQHQGGGNGGGGGKNKDDGQNKR